MFVKSSPKEIVLLGATGSIGDSTCEVLRHHRDRLRLLAIGCYRNWRKAAAIAHEFGVEHVVIADTDAAQEGRQSGEFPVTTRILQGLEGLREIAVLPQAEMVVSALVNTLGLHPTLDAIDAGKSIALANKEILVLAGEHVMQAVRRKQVSLLPVDSEHSALFQSLCGHSPTDVRTLWLTASGGAFRKHSLEQLRSATPEQALRHPNWDMGSKVTIDSATLANKGLEMIEARWLFNMQPDQIQVVVHPESIVHSMVEYVDGSFIAQLSPPSMVFPIQYALLYPDRQTAPIPSLDFRKVMQFNFEPPDTQRFPCLTLARNAMLQGGWAPAVFNAANEVAVNAFVARQIGFLEIPEIIEYTLQQCPTESSPSLTALLHADQRARQIATEQIRARHSVSIS